MHQASLAVTIVANKERIIIANLVSFARNSTEFCQQCLVEISPAWYHRILT
ncbi:MAG: hypothetical protein ONB11_05340 [candidate division KSB1 bacterium]|nr:hypothetical protein [candidate division KSB1 bacterium]MDZ7342552.1 hypothetical protein [candidate division KSB1 bacterium]